jgi:ATP-binding cassette subfamily B protein
MTDSLNNLFWPLPRLSEAIEGLALSAHLLDRRFDEHMHSASPTDEEQVLEVPGSLGRLIEATAEWMGLEADALNIEYAEIERVLRSACPLIIRLQVESGAKFLAIARGSRRNLYVIAPDGKTHKVRLETIRALICHRLDAHLATDFDQLLEKANVPKRRRDVVRSSLLRETLGRFQVGDCWMLGLPPGASFVKQLQKDRLHLRFLALALLQIVQYLLLIGSWWVIGLGALQGHFDYSWLLLWALLLLTMIPFRLMITWVQGVIAIGVGGLLKQRLLYGALRLNPDVIREEGSGKLLGRVIESAAVEALATTGGFAAMAAAVELIMAVLILSKGAGGLAHVLLFTGWAVITLLIGWRYFKKRAHWTDIRLLMTNDMVERMVGHRTRLSQESPDHWHDGEDQLLAQYIEVSRSIDRSSVLLTGLMPRGWLLVGLLGLIPSITSGTASTASLAISIGGLLLGYGSLGRLAGSLSQVTGAAIAWQQIRDLFNAAARSEVKFSPAINDEIYTRLGQLGKDQKIIEGSDLIYRYRPDAEPVLQHCDLEIFSGERILLEGSSGEGKSTLASLLVGLRMPDSGLLLLEGLDHQTLGVRGWRERVTASPQFHENYVLTGTLAFNLLMGCSWPPAPSDLEEAKTICEELGLRSLLERMPSGLSQIVGETGWQLSHGERSRIFIARALLQKADLVVLDESFAALDPENLRCALQCALNRSRTLVVVAHP